MLDFSDDDSNGSSVHRETDDDDVIHDLSQNVEQNFENPLKQKYIKMMLWSDNAHENRTIDHNFGPRYDKKGSSLMVGVKPLDFDTYGTIFIAGTRYKPTEGLYELLFKRIPSEEKYTLDNLKVYKSILIATNSHKRGYSFHNIRRDNSLKYRYVIRYLFPPPKRISARSGMTSMNPSSSSVIGKGKSTSLWMSAKARDLVHWDNPNELVSRLGLLIMSTETRNSSHRNEILNIIKELKEAAYIKGVGNSRFESLLQ